MDRILTRKKAADLIGIDVRTVDRYVSQGLLPYCKVGRHILFSFQRLCNWMSEKPDNKSDSDDERESISVDIEDEGDKVIRRRVVAAERHARTINRSNEQLQLMGRLLELSDKEVLTPVEEDEFAETEARLRTLSKEADRDEAEARAEFFEFFSGIPEPELRRIYDLLTGHKKLG